MAHDNQYTDNGTGPSRKVLGFAVPMKGQLYWDRDRHRVVEADEDMCGKCLIVAKEGE